MTRPLIQCSRERRDLRFLQAQPPSERHLARSGSLVVGRTHRGPNPAKTLIFQKTFGGMFLTRVLFRNRIPGKQWIGKHRRPRFITPLMKANMIRRLEIEAENEYWLSCSYMTKEQEYRHDEENVFALKQQRIAEQKAKFPEHKYASEYLKHLNVSKRWADS